MLPKTRIDTRLTVALGLAALMALTLAGCGGGGSSTSCATTACTVTVSWNANPDKAVNSAGGGYYLYYGTTPNFTVGTPGVSGSGYTAVTIPYAASTASAPTSTTLSLFSGTYYFRVQAYSALNRPGASGGSTSALSAQKSKTLP
jgi:hypothetical protein